MKKKMIIALALIGLNSYSVQATNCDSQTGICVGDMVLIGGREVEIKDVYSDGTGLVIFNDTSTSLFALSEMKRKVDSLDGFNLNESVLVGHTEGQIISIYGNGEVLVRFNNEST